MKLHLSAFALAFAFLLPSHVYAQSSSKVLNIAQYNDVNIKQNNKATSNWYKYTAKDGTYTIMYPKAPQEEATNVMGINTNFISFYDKDKAYISNGTKIPYKFDTNLIDTETLLNFALENMAKKTGNSIESQNDITYNGLPGKEAVVHFKDGNYFVKVRYILDVKKSVFYQVMVLSDKNNFDFPEASAFFDSLMIN